jgi:hypothetical protein
MSFLRHKGIYQSDEPSCIEGAADCAVAPEIIVSMSSSWLFLAGCSPAEPASASPTAADYGSTVSRRQVTYLPGYGGS